MKFNWGTGIAIVYTTFAVAMILFAVNASSEKYELVSDNYYDEAVRYQEKINATRNANDEETKLTWKYLQDQEAIEIASPIQSGNISGTLYFYKPDKEGDDFKIQFSTDGAAKKLIPVKKLTHGYWKINTSWKVGDKDCYSEKKIFVN